MASRELRRTHSVILRCKKATARHRLVRHGTNLDQVREALRVQLAATIAAHSASVITRIPRSVAFFSFDPAPGPAMTRSVLAETDAATRAPSSSACALASSRLSV